MARRRRNEGLMDLLVELPWWATLVLGVLLLGVSGGSGKNAPVALVFRMFAYACFAASFVGAIKTLGRKMLFASAKDIDAVRAMSWREFETLVAESYRRQGYMVAETGGGGADGGVDVILRGRGQKILVQCKQWKTFKVGVKVVREMYGIMTAEGADRVVIVTSGSYTQEAVAFARGKPIELMDGRALVQLIREVKGKPDANPAGSSVPPTHATYQKVLNVQVAASAKPPSCPRCGSTMVLRTARTGPNAGGQFWGCPSYPNCRGILNTN